MIEAASPHAYHPFMAWIDLHIDTLWAMRRLGADPVAEASGLHVDLPRLQAVDLRLAIWAIWVEADLHGPDATALALRMLGAGQALPGQSDGRLQAILGPDDLERCLAGEASGMLLGLEGAHPLQGNLEMLRGFHALGLRVLTLTWNNSNAFASGCATEPHEDHGLSALGAKLVGLAQDLGIVLDLAHASPRTLKDVLTLARRPLLVSHTACAALRPHRRNLTDVQIRDVAAAGGVVGISVYPGFVAPDGKGGTLAHVADHIQHALAVGGSDAVAIGTDLDGITRLPEGFSGVQDFPMIQRELERRGMSAETIERIAWKNAARVLRAALGREETDSGRG